MKKKESLKHHMWTKEEIKKLYEIWEKYSAEDVAEALRIEVGQVRYMVTQMRKQGFPLQKKRTKGRVMIMLEELKEELKIK